MMATLKTRFGDEEDVAGEVLVEEKVVATV